MQVAISPVFLLTGIAGLIEGMATRLARVKDRARCICEVAGERRSTHSSQYGGFHARIHDN